MYVGGYRPAVYFTLVFLTLQVAWAGPRPSVRRIPLSVTFSKKLTGNFPSIRVANKGATAILKPVTGKLPQVKGATRVEDKAGHQAGYFFTKCTPAAGMACEYAIPEGQALRIVIDAPPGSDQVSYALVAETRSGTPATRTAACPSPGCRIHVTPPADTIRVSLTISPAGTEQ